MSKYIKASELSRHIWRPGPYLYYYKVNSDVSNGKIVECMHKYANFYKKINVFEINWDDKIFHNPFTSPGEMHTVYLLYEGSIKEEKYQPDEETIKYLFLKAVEYHNSRYNRKANNRGTKPIKHKYDDKNMSECKKIEKSKYESRVNAFKKYFLNKHIIKNVEKPSEFLINQNMFTLTKIDLSSNIINSNTSNDKETCINKYGLKVENKMMDSSPWFHKVKITDIPDNIFNETLQKVTHDTGIKHISNKTNYFRVRKCKSLSPKIISKNFISEDKKYKYPSTPNLNY